MSTPRAIASTLPALNDGKLSRNLLLGGMFLVCAVFVPDIYDGTVLKPLILFATVIVFLAAEAVRASDNGGIPYRFDRIHLAFLGYLLISLLSLVMAQDMGLGIEAVAVQAGYLVLFIGAGATLEVRNLMAALFLIAAFSAAVAFTHLVLPEGSSLEKIMSQFAHISAFGNQTYYAGFIALVLPILTAQIVRGKNDARRLVYLTVLWISLAMLLISTESRSAWGAALAGIFVALTLGSAKGRRSAVGILVAIAIFVLIVVLFRSTIITRFEQFFEGGTQSSVVRRTYFYEGAWRAFLASPVIGNGAGNFVVFLPQYRSPEYWLSRSEDIVPHAHNEFLEILSETGMAGFLCFMLLLAGVFAVLFRRMRAGRDAERAVLAGVIGAACAVLLDNLWSMNLRTVPVAACFWMLLGSALGASRKQDPPPTQMRSARLTIARLVAAGIAVFGVAWIASLASARYSAEDVYLEGIRLQSASRTEEAALKFEETLHYKPDHAEARFYLCAELVRRAEYSAAAAHLDTLLRHRPSYPKAGTLLAMSLLGMRKSEQAKEAIDRELEVNRSPQSVYCAALVARALDRSEEEIRLLLEVLQLSAKSGVRDFGFPSLDRLATIPADRLPSQHLLRILADFHQRFKEDTLLISMVRKNMQHLEAKVDGHDGGDPVRSEK